MTAPEIRPVPNLRLIRDADGGASCGECGATVSDAVTTTTNTGIVDDSSPDARDWRELQEQTFVLYPCGHATRQIRT